MPKPASAIIINIQCAVASRYFFEGLDSVF